MEPKSRQQKQVTSFPRFTLGFTLIEILVALIIISIVAAIAVLSLGYLISGRHVETVAKELAIVIPLAEQQAILQPAVLGLAIQPTHYAFYRFIVNPKTHIGKWQPISDSQILGYKTIPNKVNINLQVQGKVTPLPTQKQSIQPQLIFLPSGDMTAFKMEIGAKGKMPKYQIIGQANGVVKLIGPS